jgi:hypothetical protein
MTKFKTTQGGLIKLALGNSVEIRNGVGWPETVENININAIERTHRTTVVHMG